MFIGVESVASAITVKSRLDKSAIYDCLHNLASIPQLDPSVLSFKLLRNDPFKAFYEKHPTLFVFAYDGISLETCKEHVNSFYEEFPDIPYNRRPRGILVNKKYCIVHSDSNISTTGGGEMPPFTFYGYSLDDENKGYGLSVFLNGISSYTDWVPFVSYTTSHYFNKAFLI